MNVKREDLIKQLRESYGYTKKDAVRIIKDFTDLILTNLKEGNTISLHGFGCFDMVERKARLCPNRQEGGSRLIPTHYVPRFFPGKGMRLMVKIWEDNQKRGLV